jgi:hypothetical protein
VSIFPWTTDELPPPRAERALAVAAVLLVLYAGLCKALLFRGLEYFHTDFFGFLEMSRSLFQSGELLRDNTWGHHLAIHNYYLMLAFTPLTLPLGGYGLVLGLVLLHLVAVLRAAHAPSLDLAGRVVVLGACLGPIAYAVFDNTVVGFNPELGYPPLALLLALDLQEGRTRRAIVPAVLAVLVKEDGVVLVACVLVACFAPRLWALRRGPVAERRAVARRAALSLGTAALVFVAGMLLLAVMIRVLPPPLMNAEGRLQDSFRNMGHALGGRGLLRQNLAWGLGGYLGVATLMLLPLGRRFWRGLLLLVASAPALVAVLVVSSGIYRFRYMLWPHRLAPLLALVITCIVFTLADALLPGARDRPPAAGGPAGRRTLTVAAALVALSWALQLVALDRSEGYSPWARLRAPALLRGEGTRAADLDPAELRFLRCLGERLPRGLPVSVSGDWHPALHHQSVVFEALERQAWSPPRLRVVPASAPPRDARACRDPGVGTFAVEAECALLPVVAACRSLAPARPGAS